MGRFWMVVAMCAAVAGCADDAAVSDAGMVPLDTGHDSSELPADAMPDAQAVALTVATSNGSPPSAPVFDVTRTGLTSKLTLTITNTGAASGPISLSWLGATELSIDLAASTCDGANLAAQETCTVVLTFQPVSNVAVQGVVTVTTDHGALTLPVSATSSSSDVMLTPATPDFGLIEIGAPSASFTLTNTGGFAATLGAITVSGTNLLMASTTCGTALAPGASCTILADATALGALTGTVSAVADGNTETTTFTATGAHRITIIKSGTGTGIVRVRAGALTFPALDCGLVCSGLAAGPTAIEFVPDDGTVVGQPPPGIMIILGSWFIPATTTPMTITVPFLAPSPTVRFFESTADLGLLGVNEISSTTLELQNIGTASVPITKTLRPISNGFELGTTTCGTTLAAGSSCNIGLILRPTQAGNFKAIVRVETVEGGVPYVAEAALAGVAGRRVHVTRSGTGSGTVTSSTPGIDCGGFCTGVFASDTVLTAVPDNGSTFTSWSNCPSPSGPTCTIPFDVSPRTVGAAFGISGTAQVSLVQVGNGIAEFRVANGSSSLMCNGSCSMSVTPGTSVFIDSRSLSVVSGYSGACTSTNRGCSFTATPGTNTVSVGVEKRPHELWMTLPPGVTVLSSAFDSSGNLLIVTATEVRKLSPSGLTLWSRPIVADSVATGPNDVVAVLTSTSILLLDSAGTTQWTQASPEACGTAFRRCIAVDVDGSVGVRVGTTAMRLSPTGQVTFSMHWAGITSGIGFSGGNLVLPVGGAGGFMYGQPFAADGTALPLTAAIGQRAGQGMLSASPSRILTSSNDSKSAFLGFSEVFTSSLTLEPATAVSASDTGYVMIHRNTIGTWTVQSSTGVFYDADSFGEIRDIAVSPTNHIAVVGAWSTFNGNQAYVRVFAP